MPYPGRLEFRTFVAAVIVCSLMILPACGKKEASPVPRPEGWPRIEMPSADYSVFERDGVTMLFNTGANVESREAKDGGWWIDVTYPGINDAKIYLSLTPVDGEAKLDETLDNRRERMELNTGGAVTELTQLVSDGGWTCELTLTRSSLTTPVQLLAHDNSGHVLSGSLYLNLSPGASADSISPIVKVIHRDMLETLKHLRSR